MTQRSVRPRGAFDYTKPALSHAQLLQRMKQRGLGVPDDERAERYLRHVGYYRLSPYAIPYQAAVGDHRFKEGIQFDQILDLYVFDRHLRLLVMDALERVEVAIRSALTDYMSLTHGGPHWYTNSELFSDGRRHEGLLNIVRGHCENQLGLSPEPDGQIVHRSALEHYLTTYGGPELPPSWLMLETLTFGQLEGTVRNLSARRDLSAIAESVGLNAPLLLSWLKAYVRVRNVCAHHGRLWNVGLGVYPALPQSPRVSWLSDPTVLSEDPQRAKRLYPVLVSLQSVLDTISPGSTWTARLSDLLAQHPEVPLHGMGIPQDWREDGFWSRRLV